MSGFQLTLSSNCAENRKSVRQQYKKLNLGRKCVSTRGFIRIWHTELLNGVWTHFEPARH